MEAERLKWLHQTSQLSRKSECSLVDLRRVLLLNYPSGPFIVR